MCLCVLLIIPRCELKKNIIKVFVQFLFISCVLDCKSRKESVHYGKEKEKTQLLASVIISNLSFNVSYNTGVSYHVFCSEKNKESARGGASASPHTLAFEFFHEKNHTSSYFFPYLSACKKNGRKRL